MLTPEQIKNRDGKLTASKISILLSGDKEKILNLWREMVGHPGYTEEDLSDNWPVQFGSATEPINLEWFAKKHGPISRRGEVVTHGNGWAAATLDAWSDNYQCPVEAKSVGGFEKQEIIVARYMAQVHWQMIVTGAKQCAFSVIHGAREPLVEFIAYDDKYADELWSRAVAFMECVRTLTEPVRLDPVLPPVKPIREYNMQGNNTWASAAVDWLANRAASKMFDNAAKSLREVVPPDAVRAYGHGLEAKRDRAGRLKIEEL